MTKRTFGSGRMGSVLNSLGQDFGNDTQSIPTVLNPTPDALDFGFSGSDVVQQQPTPTAPASDVPSPFITFTPPPQVSAPSSTDVFSEFYGPQTIASTPVVSTTPPVTVTNPSAQGVDVTKLVSYAGQLFKYQAQSGPGGTVQFVPTPVAGAGALPAWALPAGLLLLAYLALA